MKSINKHLLAATLAVFSLMGLTSSANASSYIALDGSSLSFDHSVEDDVDTRGLRVRLGMRLTQGFDLELHLGAGADDTTVAFDEIQATFGGLYLKGYLPIGDRSALFALAGGSSIELTQKTGFGEFSDDRSGFSYGFGLETQLSERLDLSADFMRYSLDDDEFSEVSAFNIGLKLYF